MDRTDAEMTDDEASAEEPPTDDLDVLPPPWQLAFDEAWASFRSGDFGIGAVLIEPDTGEVVSLGRNRVSEQRPASRTIGGNFLAHAEMNAFAAMERFFARGLHLYTTLEPCLMCAATSIQMNVGHVHFAARDEFFDGLDDLWEHHEYTRTRRPGQSGPLAEPIARFARVLPLSFTLRELPGGNASRHAQHADPALCAVAERLREEDDEEMAAVRGASGAVEAYRLLRRHLAPARP